MAEKPPITARYLVVDDFMPTAVAAAMRAAIEAHFNHPERHAPDTHMVWNYWHVPGLYTYLRTQPDRVIGKPLTEAFHTRLRAWAATTLGLSVVSWPYLSLYVDGCRQALHNDSINGRFGFVYSLTKNQRRSAGGETLVWREDDYFGTRLHQPDAASGFYDSIPPLFNRLVIFDDRLPHAVQQVEGTMDPQEGRFVLHGHIREGGALLQGPLAPDAVGAAVTAMANAYAQSLGAALALYHGLVVLGFDVAPDGSVSPPRVVLDRLKRLVGEGPPVDAVIRGLLEAAAGLRFASADVPTRVTLPLAFGNRVG